MNEILSKFNHISDTRILKMYLNFGQVIALFSFYSNQTKYLDFFYKIISIVVAGLGTSSIIIFSTETLLLDFGKIHKFLSCAVLIVFTIFNTSVVYDIFQKTKKSKTIIKYFEEIDRRIGSNLDMKIDGRHQFVYWILSHLVYCCIFVIFFMHTTNLIIYIHRIYAFITFYQISHVITTYLFIVSCLRRRYDALNIMLKSINIEYGVPVTYKNYSMKMKLVKEIYKKLNDVIRDVNNVFGKFIICVIMLGFLSSLSAVNFGLSHKKDFTWIHNAMISVMMCYFVSIFTFSRGNNIFSTNEFVAENILLLYAMWSEF